ncbi:type II secretion system protein [Lysinibacillus parviboronicapiens]|uniref:type II secretion system protein n=1 Tax=Lysinibacillus parviboronicapiens TaxID=436516 RepID=UPI0006D04FC9|nr:type II secretion system protein [Lysinibacillus parviboronicapiens]
MKHQKESGLTLVETLAVTVIASIILLAIYSIISQSSNTYVKQSNTNKDINDAAYALKVMTKEIRKNPKSVSIDSSTQLTINKDISDKEIRFVFDDKKQMLNRNGVILSTGIQDFQASMNGQAITIKITNVQGKTSTAELYLRKAGAK